MAKEYIERESFVDYLENAKEILWHDISLISMYAAKLVDIFLACAKVFPTVEAAPVRHGHWTEKKSSGVGGIWDYYFVCSVCGGSTPNKAYVIAPDFCPNCGAKMDGDKNA